MKFPFSFHVKFYQTVKVVLLPLQILSVVVDFMSEVWWMTWEKVTGNKLYFTILINTFVGG